MSSSALVLPASKATMVYPRAVPSKAFILQSYYALKTKMVSVESVHFVISFIKGS